MSPTRSPVTVMPVRSRASLMRARRRILLRIGERIRELKSLGFTYPPPPPPSPPSSPVPSAPMAPPLPPPPRRPMTPPHHVIEYGDKMKLDDFKPQDFADTPDREMEFYYERVYWHALETAMPDKEIKQEPVEEENFEF